MTNTPPDALRPLLTDSFATERALVDSFLDRLSVLDQNLASAEASSDSQTTHASIKAAFADLLFETIVALENHASEEEDLMKTLAFGGFSPLHYESHIEDHASLAESMGAIVEHYGSGDPIECARRLKQVLIRWRDEHIDTFDKILLDWNDPGQ